MPEVTSPDPIWEKDGQWYHADEIWSDQFGPFPTREIAEKHLADYCHWLNTGELRA